MTFSESFLAFLLRPLFEILSTPGTSLFKFKYFAGLLGEGESDPPSDAEYTDNYVVNITLSSDMR